MAMGGGEKTQTGAGDAGQGGEGGGRGRRRGCRVRRGGGHSGGCGNVVHLFLELTEVLALLVIQLPGAQVISYVKGEDSKCQSRSKMCAGECVCIHAPSSYLTTKSAHKSILRAQALDLNLLLVHLFLECGERVLTLGELLVDFFLLLSQ